MRETIVTVEIDADESVVSAEPLATPRVIVVLALHDMVRSLEERLLNIENAIDIEHWHHIQSHILKKVNVVLIIVDGTVQELVDDVEWHLDGESFASVMSTCYQKSWSLFSGLFASLERDEWDVSALVRLAE